MVTMKRLLQWWAKRQLANIARIVWEAWTNFAQSGSRQAAALAYYAIFSIFPLTLLLTVMMSKWLGPTAAQQQLADALTIFLPGNATDVIRTNVSQALAQSGSFTLIAVFGLAWSALGLFSNITDALDVIFRVPIRRSIWRQRMVAVIMAGILVVLVTASFVTSGVLRLVSAILLERPSTWLIIGTVSLPLGLNMVIFMMLFRYVPARAVHWDAVWPSAIVGAVGWELAKVGFNWYLTNLSNMQFIYGSLATAIVLLLWAYLIAAIFLFSAELCASLNDAFEEAD